MSSNLRVTELDFFQIRENLKTYMKSLQGKGKFTDYDFDGSGMAVLLDLLAYNTHYNAVNANMAINEVFLDTAERRNNIVSHAKMLGYVPRSIVASFAFVNITVNSPAGTPATLTLDRGVKFTTTVDDKQYNFTNLEAATISPINGVYSFNNVELKEGTLRTFTYTVDSFDRGQYFQVPDPKADISTLIVKVKDNSSSTAVEVYTLAKNFTDLKSDTKAYFIQEGIDGNYEIYFGDGIVGRALVGGNVVVLEWLSTNGDAANGATTFALADTIQGNSNTTIVTLNKAAGGGAGEDTDSIKFNAPLSYLAQNRVVTSDDYKTIILNNYANVETITVWGGEENDPPQYGKAYISIKPKNSNALSDIEKQKIKDQILKQKNVVSITPELIDPEYTYVYLQAFFKYNPNLTDKTAGELQALVKNVISNYNDNELKKFDGVFRHSKLLRTIDTSDASILNSTLRVYMQKRFTPVIGVAKRYELTFSSPIYSTNSTEKVINSSGFTYNGYTQYLEDKPQVLGINQTHSDEGGTHTIQMYRLVNNTKVVTNSDVGYINALKGIVVLTAFNPSAIEGTEIVITALPNSNDVAPKRNQLLQIDMSLVSVTPEIDTIATGGTSAGIGYTTTSRHEENS